MAYSKLDRVNGVPDQRTKASFERWGRLKGQSRLRQIVSVKYEMLKYPFSLLLLSDFHPRSMHFPPVGEDDELMAPSLDRPAGGLEEPESPTEGNGILSGWTESALRSDRMTWSLIGLSHALSYELGIFGNYTDGLSIVDGRVRQPGGPEKQKRADRIERLLYIYITQACGRFGFPSLFPDAGSNKFQIATILDRNYSASTYILIHI